MASMKSTLTRRRSSSPWGRPAWRNGWPHPVQNERSGVWTRPHRAHDTVIAVPHRPQKRSSGPATRPQLGHAGVEMGTSSQVPAILTRARKHTHYEIAFVQLTGLGPASPGLRSRATKERATKEGDD
jgi:hypothetical protein